MAPRPDRSPSGWLFVQIPEIPYPGSGARIAKIHHLPPGANPSCATGGPDGGSGTEYATRRPRPEARSREGASPRAARAGQAAPPGPGGALCSGDPACSSDAQPMPHRCSADELLSRRTLQLHGSLSDRTGGVDHARREPPPGAAQAEDAQETPSSSAGAASRGPRGHPCRLGSPTSCIIIRGSFAPREPPALGGGGPTRLRTRTERSSQTLGSGRWGVDATSHRADHVGTRKA